MLRWQKWKKINTAFFESLSQNLGRQPPFLKKDSPKKTSHLPRHVCRSRGIFEIKPGEKILIKTSENPKKEEKKKPGRATFKMHRKSPFFFLLSHKARF